MINLRMMYIYICDDEGIIYNTLKEKQSHFLWRCQMICLGISLGTQQPIRGWVYPKNYQQKQRFNQSQWVYMGNN